MIPRTGWGTEPRLGPSCARLGLVHAFLSCADPEKNALNLNRKGYALERST
jgi:hypothetical protein